ncbi:alpha/beta fold hydrolase [Breoghania sp. JC706]|uniref:alpha/beta hydrolase family protein n=1 Tax=Breoghania sp. JC706 TaxID=3117732 RepID=UPI00300AD205
MQETDINDRAAARTGNARLFNDQTYHFQALRVLSDAPAGAADIAEVLQAISHVPEGDAGAWYDAFSGIAKRSEALAQGCADATSSGLARQRAHSYWRTAEFFLAPKDPRREIAWERQIANFNEGLDKLGVRYERFAVPYESGHLNAIYYGAENGADKPLIVIAGGFDGTLEELYFMFGKDAVERGYNVLTYEGPGQCGLVREQNMYFTHEWEKPTSALLDHFAATFAKPERIVLLGISLGGYLAPRAAAFDDRIDGVVSFNVMYDFGAVCEPFRRLAANPAARDLPGVHWAVENGCWVFGTDTADEFVDATKPFTLAGVADRIKGDVLILAGEADHFVPVTQVQQFADALINARSVEKVIYTRETGGAEHCQLGAATLWQATVFDWLIRRFG